VFWCVVACAAAAQETAPASRPRVLFLTHSAGFRHEVVTRPAPDRLALAEEAFVGALRGRCEVVATQDCAKLSPERIANYAVVVFYTTGELPLPPAARERLLAHVRRGAGFVGIHPATDTFYEYPAWAGFLGGRFDGHPWHQPVGVLVPQGGHPAARGLPERFELSDEIYQFREYRPEPLHVILRLDPASVEIGKGKRADRDYALAWAKPYGRGRVFYTALGHRPEVWADRRFLEHLGGATEWAAGLTPWTPPRPADAEEPPLGVAVAAPYSLHAEVVELGEDAAAALVFGPGLALTARDVGRAARAALAPEEPEPRSVRLDVRFNPAKDDRPAAIEAWIDGAPAPSLTGAAPERAAAAAGLEIENPAAFRGLYAVKRR
jgi:type 1 glutamine amidotransferase